ncbi:UDP-galactose-4-epimerase [Flavobacterium sp. HMWF030]|nr:UDP-galactose-4-epimerase [Flavobacterium sp. HMWF030]
MKVLLTGATGFLGKAIQEKLSANFTFFSLSRTSGDYKYILENEIPMFFNSFDIVIHAAGKAHTVPQNDVEKEQFHKVNVEGSLNLLKGLEKVGIPKYFVFISSVSVYGLDFGNNINEEHSLEAKDPYGISKIESEKLIKKWCLKNNVICTILRLPLLVGKEPPGNLGKMIKAIKKGYYFNIDGGKAKKSMVLVDDVALIIPNVLNFGGTYHLTDGVHPDFGKLSSVLAKQMNKKSAISLPFFLAKVVSAIGDFLGSKAPINSDKLKKITSDLTFDDTKARDILKWRPKSVLDYLVENKI